MWGLQYPEINWTSLCSDKSDEHKSSKFLNAVQDSFLFQNVTQPTHFRANQEPTLIDLVFTNEESMVSHVDHGPPLGLSHHSGIHFNYTCYSEPVTEAMTQTVIYKYYAGDCEGMRRYVASCNLPDKIRTCSAEEAWDVLDRTLSEALVKFVPRKLMRGNVRTPPPWMNETIREKARLKRLAFEEKKRKKDSISRDKYARTRNQVKWEVRKAVKLYEKKIAEDSKINPKAFYKYANSKLKCRDTVPDLILNDQKATTNPERADMLNSPAAAPESSHR